MPARFCWTKQTIERLVTLTLDGAALDRIADQLSCVPHTVRKMQRELKLIVPRRRFTLKEIATIRRRYPHVKTEQVATELKCSVDAIYKVAARFNLRKTAEYLASADACRLRRGDNVGAQYRFRKGQTPPNKGTRRPGWAPGRMAETQFRKGQKPHTWMPIGSTRLSKEGYLQRKVTDTGYTPRDWVAEHNLLWVQNRGPIPPKHRVAFLDGDKTNIVMENLELVSFAEMMRRNTIHVRYPEDVRNTIMLLGAVKRRLRERAEKEQPDAA